MQEAASSEDPMVQFHAITLLHQIKQNDRLAVSKLVLHCIRSNIRSPLAICTLIRYSSEVPCIVENVEYITCLLYTSPSPRDAHESRMPSSA